LIASTNGNFDLAYQVAFQSVFSNLIWSLLHARLDVQDKENALIHIHQNKLISMVS
jgi:hypothetical protein